MLEVLARPSSQPVAAAGPDLTGSFDRPIRLDGTLSSDPDGDPLSYYWSVTGRPEGAAAELSDPSAPRPEFFADVPGDYELSLSVHDGQVGSLPDRLLVSVV